MRHKRVTNKKQSVNQRLDNNRCVWITNIFYWWRKFAIDIDICFSFFFFCIGFHFAWIHSPQHQESHAKNCDICNARAARVQGAYTSASVQTKNLTKSVANPQVDEGSIFINNSSTSRQTTLSSSKSHDSGDKGEFNALRVSKYPPPSIENLSYILNRFKM